MVKSTVKVINVDLGIDVEKEIQKVSKVITSRNNEVISTILNECKDKPDEITNEILEKIYSILEKTTKDAPITQDDISAIIKVNNFGSLISKIKSHAKKIHSREIKRDKRNGKSAYWLDSLDLTS